MGHSDEIALTGLTVFGRHGVYDHERRDGQEFVVDVVMRLDMRRAAETDDVADTVHYGELASKVAAVIGGRPVALIETLATRIADAVLAEPLIDSVRVTVHKPHAPIALQFDDIAVTIERSAPSPRIAP